MDHDVLIAGAGPAGLCLARALSGCGLRIGLVEPQPEATLADPPFDGREIALTQHSARILRTLGVWDQLGSANLSPLRDARIFDGPSPDALVISHARTRHGELGWLVSNHLIRRAAWSAVQDARARNGDIELYSRQRVATARSDTTQAQIQLDDGRALSARLLIAADSRFSPTRRAMGIAADQHDFGRNMLVCVMTHAQPHDHAAWEWFDHGQTLALLPMNDDPETGAHRSSVVVTLRAPEIERLSALPPQAFNDELTRRFANRLGAMQLASTRHVYPLVGVYPRELVAQRFACVGDAAVGMHPVTAHGFNFGLLGVERLATLVRDAHGRGADIAAPALLDRYARGHRLATQPLYLATRWIAQLYTAESPAARALRQLALRWSRHTPPFQHLVAAALTG